MVIFDGAIFLALRLASIAANLWVTMETDMHADPSNPDLLDRRVSLNLFSRRESDSVIEKLFAQEPTGSTIPLRGDLDTTLASFHALLKAAVNETVTGQQRAVATTTLVGAVAIREVPTDLDQQVAAVARDLALLDETFGIGQVLAVVLRAYPDKAELHALVRPADDGLHASREWGPRAGKGAASLRCVGIRKMTVRAKAKKVVRAPIRWQLRVPVAGTSIDLEEPISSDTSDVVTELATGVDESVKPLPFDALGRFRTALCRGASIPLIVMVNASPVSAANTTPDGDASHVPGPTVAAIVPQPDMFRADPTRHVPSQRGRAFQLDYTVVYGTASACSKGKGRISFSAPIGLPAIDHRENGPVDEAGYKVRSNSDRGRMAWINRSNLGRHQNLTVIDRLDPWCRDPGPCPWRLLRTSMTIAGARDPPALALLADEAVVLSRPGEDRAAEAEPSALACGLSTAARLNRHVAGVRGRWVQIQHRGVDPVQPVAGHVHPGGKKPRSEVRGQGRRVRLTRKDGSARRRVDRASSELVEAIIERGKSASRHRGRTVVSARDGLHLAHTLT